MRARHSLAALLGAAALVGAGCLSGCGSRVETAAAGADSTYVYASRMPGGPNAAITFCRKVSSRTGRPIGAGQRFTARDGERVRALVEIDDPAALGDRRDLMFHLVWVGPDGKEFYIKRVDLAPNASDRRLESAISIPPGRRDPGIYTLRVYLFRELIAEKRFELQLPPQKG